jgi:hypothetical protein
MRSCGRGRSFMRSSLARFWPLFLALALLAAPAAAEVYIVTLNNGQVFETAYQPQEASWDASMVLFLTDQGNWIGISKADVKTVENTEETSGFGIKIADNTYEVGISPNDLAEAEAELAASGGTPAQGSERGAQLLQQILQQQQTAVSQRQAEQSYTMNQFVEPSQTQGLPSRFIGYSNRPNQ